MADDISADRLKQAAEDRLDDAKALRPARPNGSAYLAGYVIECWLKAAILKGLGHTTTEKFTDPNQKRLFFKHRYEELRNSFARAIPTSVQAALLDLPAEVSGWDPQWRYNRPNKTATDADTFIQEAETFKSKVRRST